MLRVPTSNSSLVTIVIIIFYFSFKVSISEYYSIKIMYVHSVFVSRKVDQEELVVNYP